jgi:PAS domain S-box-containing protein
VNVGVTPQSRRNVAASRPTLAPLEIVAGAAGALRRPLPDMWHAAVDAMPLHVALLDSSGVIVAVNAGWSKFAAANGGGGKLLGVGADYLGVCARAAGDEPFALEALSALRDIAAGEREIFLADYRCDSPTEQRWFAMRAAPCRIPGEPDRLVVVHTDITARHRAEAQSRSSAAIVAQLDAAVISTSVTGEVTEWNSSAERLVGWTREEVIGRPLPESLFALIPTDYWGLRREALALTGLWQADLELRSRDGLPVTVNCRTAAVADATGTCEGYATVAIDIAERVEAERRHRDLADYLAAAMNGITDGLVSLDEGGCVTYINTVGEQLLGFSHDQLLGQVMHDLTHHRRADGSALSIEESPITLARREDRPIRVDDDSFVRSDGSDLPVAYTASPFHTSQGVAGVVVVFRDISEEKARQQRLRDIASDFRWAGRVRDALDQSVGSTGFFLDAQPIVDIATRSLLAEEVLLRMRWDGEIVAPGRFLAAAANHGLMAQIDRWVLGQAVALVRGGRAVALNLSHAAFTDFGLLEEIEADLELTPGIASLLTFEVTETSVIEDVEAAGRFIAGLHDLGCKVALDDFGAGYSGFSYLKRLPLDHVKIDREFVHDLAYNDASHHVVEAILNVSRTFGYTTIAEGVEDAETLRVLAELGVEYAQGYLLGRPHQVEPLIADS